MAPPLTDPSRSTGGFADLVDYRLTAWSEDHAEVALTVVPKHLNRSGVLHGGVLTTIMDAALGYTGIYSPPGEEPRRAFTLSLSSRFIAVARPGDQLTVKARRSGGGRSLFFAACEVHDQDGRLIAQGDGVFKYITLRE